MNIPPEQYNALLAELSSLRKENEEMKTLLMEHELAYEGHGDCENGGIVELYSPVEFPPVGLGVEERVALFRSLFLLSITNKCIVIKGTNN